MRFSLGLLLSTLTTLSLTSAALIDLKDVERVTKSSSTVIPGRYIVEFDSSAHLTSSLSKRAATPHEAVYNQLKARGLLFDINMEFDSDVFIGASMTFGDDDISTLSSAEGVLSISPVHSLSIPDPISRDDAQWPAPQQASTTAPSAQKVSPSVTCTGKGRKQTCTTAAPQPTGLTGFSVLPQIQVDKVHASGNKGKGIKIGIVDGGVDYYRPALGGCFGQGCKVAGGYDFVGDLYDGGANLPIPDNDPLDQCYSHGTIAAGIIGANDNEYNVTGVAPEANLYIYRVFGCNGASSDDLVIQGMQRAYKENMDVISVSVGSVKGWTTGAMSVVASRIVNKGVTVSVSAGNQGQVGAFYSYNPASGLGVLNVGSSDSNAYPAQLATVSTGYGPIAYYNFQPFTMSPTPLTPGAQYPITAYTTDPNVAADGCLASNGAVDVAGKIVIIRRGGCSLSDKARFAFLAGAIGVLVVNTDGALPIYQLFPKINFGLINFADGNYLLNQLASGASPTLSFDFAPIAIPNTDSGNTTSYFSEIGPTNDLYMAPSIIAPGSNILSLLPYKPEANFYGWSITDGTSWSSAYGAGAAALYLKAKGTQWTSPKQIKEAFEASAQYLPTSRTDNTPLTVAQQGSGQLQVFDAINRELVVSPTELLLNDTANFASTQYITLTNKGRKLTTYKLSHVAAGTALHFEQGSIQPASEPVPQAANAASVQIIGSTVVLWPGASTVVRVRFSPPRGLDAKQFPIYSGWIKIIGGNTNTQIPYLGVAASMKDMPILDTTDFAFGFQTPVIIAPNQAVQSGPATYSLSGDDYPTVMYRQAAGTPSLVIDLVDANANLGITPNYNTKRDASDRFSLEPRRGQSMNEQTSRPSPLLQLWCLIVNNRDPKCKDSDKNNTYKKVPIVGTVFVASYVPRNTNNADGQGAVQNTVALNNNGQFSNGTAIPNGQYKLLLRTLKITGDPKKQSDYETWLSQPFTVAR